MPAQIKHAPEPACSPGPGSGSWRLPFCICLWSRYLCRGPQPGQESLLWELPVPEAFVPVGGFLRGVLSREAAAHSPGQGSCAHGFCSALRASRGV